MKRVKLLMILGLSVVIFSACDRSDDAGDERTAVRFVPTKTTTIVASTKTVGNSWSSGDAIGVFMLSRSGVLPTDIAEGADNRKYVYGGGGFASAEGQQIYYPMSEAGKVVDFVAYYPWKVSAELTGYHYSVDLTAQNNPGAIDLLYAKAVAVESSSEPVRLSFDHLLAKMIVKVKRGDGMAGADFSEITAKVTGMPSQALFSLADGTSFTNLVKGDFAPLRLATTEPGVESVFQAIVIPQAGNAYSDRTMIFTLQGENFVWTIPNGAEFCSGEEHSYEIVVKKTGVEIQGVTISPWDDTSIDPEEGEIPV